MIRRRKQVIHWPNFKPEKEGNGCRIFTNRLAMFYYAKAKQTTAACLLVFPDSISICKVRKVKAKISLLQAMEAHRVARG
jgi:hypothetical protein